MSPSSNLRGIIAMVIAMGVFIASDSASKFVLGSLPVFEVVALRGLAGAVLCFLLVLALGQDVRHIGNPLALARGLCEVGANFGFTFGILHLPIADVTAIAQTAPLLVLVGAALIYRERLGPSRLVLIALGIAGALLVAQPGATAASPYAMLGFLVAVAAAGRDLITRKVAGDVPALVAALAVLTTLTVAAPLG
jgi:drug/metabolite transporter (DMT)-like permease